MLSKSLPEVMVKRASIVLAVVIVTVLIAAASFIGPVSGSAFAQSVAPTCPEGYVLSGNNCIPAAKPSCPSGYSFSGGKCIADAPEPVPARASGTIGPWAFITREVYGVKNAVELDGAKYCAVADSPAADAAKDFFRKNDLASTLVPVDSGRAGIEEYSKNNCDVLVVEKRTAKSTANSLKPAGAHMVLPERIGEAVAAPEPPERPAAEPAPPPTTAAAPPQQAPPKPQPAVRKPRCSGITYAFTRGNTCACSGGRVFTGSACVRRY